MTHHHQNQRPRQSLWSMNDLWPDVHVSLSRHLSKRKNEKKKNTKSELIINTKEGGLCRMTMVR